MTNITKLDEKIKGEENFRAWKYIIMLILEEHDVEGYIKWKVKEPERDEANAKHMKHMIKSKRIIVYSIKDHFIPQVSSKNTPKEMFDWLTNLFKWKNINKRMTLRNQLKGLKIQKEETKNSWKPLGT